MFVFLRAIGNGGPLYITSPSMQQINASGHLRSVVKLSYRSRKDGKSYRKRQEQYYELECDRQMQSLNQLLTFLGAPILLKRIDLQGDSRAAIARWRFDGGHVEVDATDAVRVVMCLACSHEVRWQLNGETTRRALDVSSISVVSPREQPNIFVKGTVDIVQVLLEPGLINEVANRGQIHIPSLFDSQRERLRPHLLQALVAVKRGAPDDALLLGSAVYALAEQLSLTAVRQARQMKGGLARAALRRVEELICDRLDRTPEAPPTLEDMASAASLSVHHFIKAFRKSMGVTPYAYSLDCRLQRSINLLSRRATSVAEAAYQTGFNSPAHFVSSFRRRIGVTPGAFCDAATARTR